MEGVVATFLAVAVVAGLMIIGIRTKLPPPDPNWREHSPPPPTRLELILLALRFAWYPVVIGVAFTERKPLVLGVIVVWMGLLLAATILRIQRARRARRGGAPADLAI